MHKFVIFHIKHTNMESWCSNVIIRFSFVVKSSSGYKQHEHQVFDYRWCTNRFQEYDRNALQPSNCQSWMQEEKKWQMEGKKEKTSTKALLITGHCIPLLSSSFICVTAGVQWSWISVLAFLDSCSPAHAVDPSLTVLPFLSFCSTLGLFFKCKIWPWPNQSGNCL